MDMCLSPMQDPDLFLMQPQVIGHIPNNLAGHGHLIILGDGLRFTTGVGITIGCTAGFGYPICNGDQLGWFGEILLNIMDGRLCLSE